jgi:hypothetical protein
MADSYNPDTGAKYPQSTNLVKVEQFTRPANSTAYALGDAVAPNATAITAATNANPSVITSAAHGLATDDRVTITGAVGNTAINGTFKVVVLTVNTFSLKTEAGTPVAGNGAWTSGGTVQRLLRLIGVVNGNGQSGSIVAVKLQVRNPVVTLGQFRVRFYSRPIAQVADNALFTLLTANRAYSLCYLDLPILVTEGAGSDASEVIAVPNQAIPFTCDPASADLFPQITSLGAFVPAASDTFRLEVTIRRSATK